MGILGIICIVVGVALFFAGRIVAGSLPPNFQRTEDEDFLQLLHQVGKMIAILGGVFVVAGIVMSMLSQIL